MNKDWLKRYFPMFSLESRIIFVPNGGGVSARGRISRDNAIEYGCVISVDSSVNKLFESSGVNDIKCLICNLISEKVFGSKILN